MKGFFTWGQCIVAAGLLGLGACQKEEEQGRFFIVNASGQDLTLHVFSTQNRTWTPTHMSVPTGGQVENRAVGGMGGSGSITQPLLAYLGDSVRVEFADGKQLLHYCPAAQPCVPTHTLLSLTQYEEEIISPTVTRYTFTFTPTDYASAR